MTSNIQIIHGDITKLQVDAIVNAANSSYSAAVASMELSIVPPAETFWKKAARLADVAQEHVK